MSKYTAELREIIELGFNIFDFDYNRTAESKAVVSDEDLQNGFIDHYYFREVGFETLERFKHKLKTQWKESLGELDNLLVAYNEKIDVKSNRGSSRNSTINFTGNLSRTYENETSHNNKNIENDTPKNSLDISLESGHASKLILNNDTQNDNSTENNNQENTTTNNEQNKGYEGITEIELLELYHDKIKDIQTEFYNSFDNLFMQIF